MKIEYKHNIDFGDIIVTTKNEHLMVLPYGNTHICIIDLANQGTIIYDDLHYYTGNTIIPKIILEKLKVKTIVPKNDFVLKRKNR